MALFTVVTMTSGWPLRSAISAASRLSSLPCPTWWAYTWCALRGWLVSAEVGWGRKPPENMVKMAKILQLLWQHMDLFGKSWKMVLIWFHENHCRTWKKVESCWDERDVPNGVRSSMDRKWISNGGPEFGILLHRCQLHQHNWRHCFRWGLDRFSAGIFGGLGLVKVH